MAMARNTNDVIPPHVQIFAAKLGCAAPDWYVGAAESGRGPGSRVALERQYLEEGLLIERNGMLSVDYKLLHQRHPAS